MVRIVTIYKQFAIVLVSFTLMAIFVGYLYTPVTNHNDTNTNINVIGDDPVIRDNKTKRESHNHGKRWQSPIKSTVIQSISSLVLPPPFFAGSFAGVTHVNQSVYNVIPIEGNILNSWAGQVPDDIDLTTSPQTSPLREYMFTPKDREGINNLSHPKMLKLKYLKNAALVVLAHNRPIHLKRTIMAVKNARLSGDLTKYISQDGNHSPTQVIAQFYNNSFEYIKHEVSHVPESMRNIATHYKLALNYLFGMNTKGKKVKKEHSHVIILEDDLLVSADFFESFEALAPLLDIDPTLWCISSWNDNGFSKYHLPPDMFFRTSFFPGLGWMLKRELWVNELSSIFPQNEWDQWMRSSSISKRRECISPWLSRNKNIGSNGATVKNKFFALYLDTIGFADTIARKGPINYGDLSYLLNRNYFRSMRDRIERNTEKNIVVKVLAVNEVSFITSGTFLPNHKYIIPFQRENYHLLARKLSICQSPRAHYRNTMWLQYGETDRTNNKPAQIFLIHRSLSAFIPNQYKVHRHEHLKPVIAYRTGMSCDQVCMEHKGSTRHGSTNVTWSCDQNQFDFIDDGKVMERPNWDTHFSQCELKGHIQSYLRGPFLPIYMSMSNGQRGVCVYRYETSTCVARRSFTRRLCPCVATFGGNAGNSNGFVAPIQVPIF